MTQFAIRTENLGKMYRLGELHGGGLFARLAKRSPAAGADEREFWALRGVDLELMQGESLAIVGGNGAGKSTLLKLLSRITAPTTGRALVRGRLASLLEVGTGFHPELTGRENVFLNGAILGMRKAEVARKFDEIVAFAGVEKFIDTPVKRYSSGMYVRLAFAVAAHLEPDTLIVDEVLAVGDAAFQQRCLGKMDDASRQGRTVLFVSHNMSAVKKLCSKSIWLANGQVRAAGKTDEVVAQYLLETRAAFGTASPVPGRLFEGEAGTAKTQVLRVDLADAEAPADYSGTWEPARFRIRFRVSDDYASFAVQLSLATTDGVPVVASGTDSDEGLSISLQAGCHEIECAFPNLPLAAGEYALGVTLVVPLAKARKQHTPGRERTGRILHEPDLCRLHVEERDVFGTGIAPRAPACLVATPSRWSVPVAVAESEEAKA